MQKSLLTLIILILTPYGALGIDLYSPSLPAIAAHLHVDFSLAMLTITTYLVGLGIGQLITGTLSDVYGRRSILLSGIGIFFIASIAIIFSRSIYTIFFFRLIQGLGVAATSSISKSLVTDNYAGQELVKVSSLRTIIWGLGPIIAPAMGGYLQFFFGWLSAFYFYVITSFLLLLTVAFFLKETCKVKAPLNLRAIINNYTHIFTERKFLGALILLGACYSLIIVFHVLAPFLIQAHMKYSVIVYGHMALLVGIAYLIGTLINYYLIKNYSADNLILAGLIIMFTASVFGGILSSLLGLNLYVLVAATFCVVFAIGFIFPNGSAKCLAYFPKMAGTAAAIIGCFYIISAGLVSYIASFFETSNQTTFFIFYCVIIMLGGIIWKITTVSEVKSGNNEDAS